MATKDEHLDLEIAHFNECARHIKDMKECCEDTIKILLNKGLIQVSTAFEHALADLSGGLYTVASCDGSDFSDGTDAKSSCVRTSCKGTSYSAPISNLHCKTGSLRVQVFERKLNKFYWFFIPRDAYKDIPRTSNIEIPFELDGTPRRIPKKAVRVCWWDFEVDSFETLSTTKEPERIIPFVNNN